MPLRFDIVPLARTRIDQAFPIVQSVLPRMNIDSWRRYADRLIAAELRNGRPTTGILAADANGYLYGLCSFRLETSLQHGEVLVVDDFMVSDLVHQRSVAASLLAGIDGLARQRGCTAIHTALPAEDASPLDCRRWLVEELRGQGHHLDMVVMCKEVRPAAPSAA